MVPTPVLAVVLLFPVTEETEAARRTEREAIAADGQKLPGEGQPPLLHIQQNIGNACGTIGLLHAACHAVVGGDVAAPPADSWLGKFISHTGGLSGIAPRGGGAPLLGGAGGTGVASLPVRAVASALEVWRPFSEVGKTY